MIRSRLWPTVALVLILVAADGAAQTGAVMPSDVSPFMGTWVLTMTNPEGTEQIVLGDRRFWIDRPFGVSRDLALIVPESWGPPKENDISILRRGHAAQPAEGLSATYSARSAMTSSTRVARRVGT